MEVGQGNMIGFILSRYRMGENYDYPHRCSCNAVEGFGKAGLSGVLSMGLVVCRVFRGYNSLEKL
eukprot:6648916-Karenia_brevis.AAC.1